MNEIFGLSMDTLMVVIIVLLGLIALAMGFLALRNPLFFRLGLRNIPRRRAQTLLIIFGLMLSTLIVSSAFTTGDTLSTSLRSQAIEITGRVDHLVQYETTPGRNVSEAESVVPQRVADDLKAAFAGDERIVGFIRALNDTASIRNIDSGQQLALSYLLGLDPAEADAIGGIPGADGERLSLTGTGADGIILNATAAQELAAQPGHQVLVRARGVEHPFRVAGNRQGHAGQRRDRPAQPAGRGDPAGGGAGNLRAAGRARRRGRRGGGRGDGRARTLRRDRRGPQRLPRRSRRRRRSRRASRRRSGSTPTAWTATSSNRRP